MAERDSPRDVPALPHSRSHAVVEQADMAPTFPVPEHSARSYAWLAWLAYPLLAIAGALTHRQIFPLLALLSLLTAVMLPRLLSRRAGPWLLWLVLLTSVLVSSHYGFAGLILESVPVLVNALLGYWFGRTLRTSTPLVARFILAIEGADRLAQPGVARYARQLTWFWTLLLVTQATVLAILLLCAAHSGLLFRFGMVPPLQIPEHVAAIWLHAGGYILLGTVFLLEYGYRRWRLRHLVHPGLREMLLQLSRQAPHLLRGARSKPP
ncbi:MAG: xanthomonadin biosynthesis protein [Rhodanobacter sp.]